MKIKTFIKRSGYRIRITKIYTDVPKSDIADFLKKLGYEVEERGKTLITFLTADGPQEVACLLKEFKEIEKQLGRL